MTATKQIRVSSHRSDHAAVEPVSLVRLPDGSEVRIAGRARCPVVVTPDGMPFCLDCLRRGRQPQCPAYAEVNDPVYLVREPDNPADPNAVMVLLRQGYQIGYVPREEAEELAPLLDAGYKQRAWIKKIVQGEAYPLPYMVAEIYQPDADVPGLASPDELPEKRPAPIPQSSAIRDWPCSCLLAGGGLAALLLLFVLSGGLRGC